MKKIGFGLVLSMGLVLSGCGLKKDIKQDMGNYAQMTNLANPASINCEQKGGLVKIENGSGGQFGLCIFADGSSCEEWAFYRGECSVGQSLVKSKWK